MYDICKYVNVFQHISDIESNAGTLLHFGCQFLPHRKHWCWQTVSIVQPCPVLNCAKGVTRWILSQTGSGMFIGPNLWNNTDQCWRHVKNQVYHCPVCWHTVSQKPAPTACSHCLMTSICPASQVIRIKQTQEKHEPKWPQTPPRARHAIPWAEKKRSSRQETPNNVQLGFKKISWKGPKTISGCKLDQSDPSSK